MRWMSLCLFLAAHGCFDPTDLDVEDGDGGPTTSEVGSDTNPSASDGVTEGDSVTLTEASQTASESESDTQPTATSVDTSTSVDPTTDADSTTTETGPDDDSSTSAGTPDVGVPGPCDTFDPECPAGFKCNAWADDGGSSWNALFCFPLDRDPVGVGEACEVEGSGVSGLDNCEFGAMCWEVDPETNQGECVAFCGGTSDDPTCAVGHTCYTANDGVLNLCLPYCDPLLQDCNEGQACYPFAEGFICAPDASGEDGAFGDPCEFLNVCDPGLFCANADMVPSCDSIAGCCTPFCDVEDPSGCPNSMQQCIAWFEEGEAPPGLENVGACLLP